MNVRSGSQNSAEGILEEAPTGDHDADDDGLTLRTAYEHDVVPYGCETTAPRTRARARAVTAALRPVAQEQAHREARDEREVSVRPTSDGIAQLIGVIPEVLAYAIFDPLTAAAAAMDDDRTTDQRRADLFCDLLLTAMASTAMGIDLDAIRPTGQVTIAASTLAGRDDAMAELDGVGPIHPDLARSLAGRALSFSRLFLDPDGMVTNVDTYVPSSRCNLACFCTSHHPLKHPNVDARHRWTVGQQPEGTLVWASPLGREYVDTPELRVMFV
ncbi:13E12 repeat family protein [Microbacterium sp. AK031]|uniref:13E12 repeat family protein n=1 Tax=Microbacterium sp. AK031 TaxID=2723076 RepID=UPI0021685060|nr:13E12 repeat family protein [Microbacterium sp. AK031]MCS3845004.1 hypothetical protein [Microbacterium sp. AK031]